MLNPRAEALPGMPGLKFPPLVPMPEAGLARQLGKSYPAISKLPRSTSALELSDSRHLPSVLSITVLRRELSQQMELG